MSIDTTWAARTITFPVTSLEVPYTPDRAGWPVKHPNVARAMQVLDRLREKTEAAWEDGNTAHAIRCARRVLAAEAALRDAQAAFPDVIVQGPLQAGRFGVPKVWQRIQGQIAKGFGDVPAVPLLQRLAEGDL